MAGPERAVRMARAAAYLACADRRGRSRLTARPDALRPRHAGHRCLDRPTLDAPARRRPARRALRARAMDLGLCARAEAVLRRHLLRAAPSSTCRLGD